MRLSGFRLVLLSSTALAGAHLVPAAQAQEVIDGAHEIVAGDGSGTRPAQWDIGADLVLGGGSRDESVLEITGTGRVTSVNAQIGRNSDASVIVAGEGAVWETSGTLDVAGENHLTGGLIIADGGFVSSGESAIGTGSGSVGEVLLTGGGSRWTVDGVLQIGGEGEADLQILDGAAADMSALFLSADAGGRSSVTVSGPGSRLTAASNSFLGGTGTNTLTVENGGRLVTGGMQITGSAGNAATVTVTGDNSVWEAATGTVVVGDFSEGHLDLLDGGRLEAGSVIIGRNSAGRGAVTVNGADSALETRVNLIVGHTGDGTLSLGNNARLDTAGQTVLGWSAQGDGRVDLRGAGTSWTAAGPVIVGRSGTGGISAIDGAQLSLQSLTLGAEADSTGYLDLQGSGTRLEVGGDVTVGQGGHGGLYLADGARMSARSLQAGVGTEAGGEVIVYGGLLALEETLRLGGSGFAGAALLDNGSITAAGVAVGPQGRFFIGGPPGRDSFAAGTLTTPTLAIEAGGELIFNHADTDYLLDTNLSGEGSILVSAGATTLQSATGFAGTVAIETGASLTASSAILTGNIANEGTLVFNETAGGSYRSSLIGSGAFVKTGAGHLTVADLSGFQGDLTVDEGMLTYNGLYSGTASIGGNGTLSGSGTFHRLNVQNGGTFAPGESIGTTHVSGGLSFGAGAVYEVEVTAAGASDLTVVEAGTSIDASASVSVLAENRTDTGLTYASETNYTILQSEDGITGSFGAVTENFAFLEATLTYDPTSVYLTLTMDDTATPGTVFSGKARTANQKAVATGVASLGSGGLFDTVLLLPDGEAEAAFDALSGEAHASLRGQMSQEVSRSRDAVERRIRSAFAGVAALGESAFNGQVGRETAGGWVLWGEGYGTWGSRDGNGNAAGFSRTSGGLVAGGDREITGAWRIGAFGSFGRTSFEADARASSGTTSNLTAGVYSGHEFGALRFHAGSSVSWHGFDMSRKVRFTGLNETLSSDYTGWTGQVFGEAAYTFELDQARLSPFAGASVVSSQTEAFQESGGSAALSVASASDTAATTTLGLRAETAPLLIGQSFLHVSGTLAWRHTFGDVSPENSMRFAGGDAFTVSGVPLDRNTALLGASLTWSRGEALSLDLGYTGEIGETAQDHGARAGVSLRF